MSNAKLIAIIPAELLPLAGGVYAVSELDPRDVKTAMGSEGLVWSETWQLHDRPDDPRGFVLVEMVEVRFDGVPHYLLPYSPVGTMAEDLGAVRPPCANPTCGHSPRQHFAMEAESPVGPETGPRFCSECHCEEFAGQDFPVLAPGEAALAVSLTEKGLAARLIVRVA